MKSVVESGDPGTADISSIEYSPLPRCGWLRRYKMTITMTAKVTSAEQVASAERQAVKLMVASALHRASWSTPQSSLTVRPAGQVVVHVLQTASLVSVADSYMNWPPPHAVTSEQARSELAVGWTLSYETLTVHGGDQAVQARSDDAVGGAVS